MLCSNNRRAREEDEEEKQKGRVRRHRWRTSSELITKSIIIKTIIQINVSTTTLDQFTYI